MTKAKVKPTMESDELNFHTNVRHRTRSEQVSPIGPSIEHMSYVDLLKHQDHIAKRIAELRERQFDDVVDKLRSIVEGSSHVAKPEKFLKALREQLKDAARPKRKPYKMRIYRHPDDASLQWTRRNRHVPQWIQEFIDKGVNIEQFRIDSET